MGKKSENTKEKIRRQAYRLFAEKGFKEVTMTDICERTGLSRGGLYRYYSGTAQIFSEILSEEYVIADRIEKGKAREPFWRTCSRPSALKSWRRNCR